MVVPTFRTTRDPMAETTTMLKAFSPNCPLINIHRGAKLGEDSSSQPRLLYSHTRALRETATSRVDIRCYVGRSVSGVPATRRCKEHSTGCKQEHWLQEHWLQAHWLQGLFY